MGLLVRRENCKEYRNSEYTEVQLQLLGPRLSIQTKLPQSGSQGRYMLTLLKKVCPSLGWERSHSDATLVKFAENLPSGVPKKAIYWRCLTRHTLLQNLSVVGIGQESCCLLLSVWDRPWRSPDAAGSPPWGKPHMLEKLAELHTGTQSRALSSCNLFPVPTGEAKYLKGSDPLS